MVFCSKAAILFDLHKLLLVNFTLMSLSAHLLTDLNNLHLYRQKHLWLLRLRILLFPYNISTLNFTVMSRQAALEKELDHLTGLNNMADQLLETIKKTQQNIATSKKATDSTSALLEDWIKILNQTKFVGDVLESPSWKGPRDFDTENVQSMDKEEAQLDAELQALEKENSTLQQQLDSIGSLLPVHGAKRIRR